MLAGPSVHTRCDVHSAELVVWILDGFGTIVFSVVAKVYVDCTRGSTPAKCARTGISINFVDTGRRAVAGFTCTVVDIRLTIISCKTRTTTAEIIVDRQSGRSRRVCTSRPILARTGGAFIDVNATNAMFCTSHITQNFVLSNIPSRTNPVAPTGRTQAVVCTQRDVVVCGR